jgi:Sigma-70 region 2
MRLPAGLPAAAFGSGDEEATIRPDARTAVTALYREHALGLARLAYITSGSRSVAEDVVQEAFCGLYRRWNQLADTDKAVGYLRSSVLNGCRSAWRRAARRPRIVHLAPAESAEAAALSAEDEREVVAALRHLPDRQRAGCGSGHRPPSAARRCCGAVTPGTGSSPPNRAAPAGRSWGSWPASGSLRCDGHRVAGSPSPSERPSRPDG